MGNANTDPTGEDKLRGSGLDGSEQEKAVDHTAYSKSRDPDTVVRVDGEADTLYSDGLELDDDEPPIINTDNAR